MDCTFQNFLDLNIIGHLIGLESIENMYEYWCYPLHKQPLGLEGCILYCFINGYDTMVFACNPEAIVDKYVYPLANNFEDFIRLILACGSTNPIEQIIWMTKKQFEDHMYEEELIKTTEQKDILRKIEDIFNLQPMENPYEYVKDLQKKFDDSKIMYTDQYYDVLGIEKTMRD